MLSQQDFSTLESMMTRIVKVNNEEMKSYIDEKFVEAMEHTDEKFAEAMAHTDEKFAEAMAHTDEKFAEAMAHTDEKFAEAMAHTNEKFAEAKEYTDESIASSESFLLDEIDRFYQYTKADIQKLSDKIDEIAEYYRIRKTEDDMYNYVIHLYNKQQEEIDEIKQVLAM